jgi:hypothetical protein
MNGKRAKELRQLSGYVKPSKKPTPVLSRSHTWRERWEPNPRPGQRARRQIRPTQLAVLRYGLKDLGWGPRSRYYTLTGKVRKEVYHDAA